MIKDLISTAKWFISNKDSNKVLIVLFIAISIVGFLTYNSHKTQNELIRELRTDVKNLRKENKDLNIRNKNLELQVQSLISEMIVLKASTDFFPFPYWIKNLEGKMIYVNKAYEKKFLIPKGLKAIDYIGKKDSVVWSKKISKSFNDFDMKVIKTGEPLTLYQTIDNNKKILVTKYPYKINGFTFGVAGVVYQEF